MARILVVEDESAERERVAAALTAAHHDVITAEDGEEAIGKLRLRSEVIILDLVTPILDGYDVLKRLRATPGHETTPVIVASGVATGDWARWLGANRFLKKPIRERELMDAVDQVLRESP